MKPNEGADRQEVWKMTTWSGAAAVVGTRVSGLNNK